MKSNKKWILSFILLFIFGGLVVFSNHVSNSLKDSNSLEDFSIEIEKDEHVVPSEKVFVSINGAKENMANVSLMLGNDKTSFKVDLLDLQTETPYFELPYYSDKVIAGLKYYIKEATIKYEDGRIVRYTTSKNDTLYMNIDERDSYFVVDEISNDINAWRNFKGVDFSDYTYTNGNIYFKIYGDTTEMVDIELEFVRVDEKKNFIADVEGFGNRTFFSLANTDVEVAEEYYLKGMTIYYSNGGSYYYSADNYANIINNRIFISNIIEEGSLNVEEPEAGVDETVTDGNQPNATNNITRENNLAGGLVILFLVIVGSLGIFIYLKDEDR